MFSQIIKSEKEQKRMCTMKQGLSILLVLTLLVQIFPVGIFADEPDDYVPETEDGSSYSDGGNELTEGETESKTPVYVEGELPELRGVSEKHFRMSDGSYMAVMYGVPIHYQDTEGNWQDYDNTLQQKPINEAILSPAVLESMGTTGEEGSVYEAVNGQEVRQFAAALNESGYLFTAAHGETSVSMSIDRGFELNPNGDPKPGEQEPVETISAEVENPVETHSQMTDEEWQALSVDKQIELEKYGSSLMYKNVWKDVDLSYQLRGGNVKESIVSKMK